MAERRFLTCLGTVFRVSVQNEERANPNQRWLRAANRTP